MIKLIALITWQSEKIGGLKTTPFSGIQPSFGVGEDLIISQVCRTDGGHEMRPNEEVEVEIRLPYGEVYQDQLVPGFEFNLNVGSRAVAKGRILRIIH